MRLIAVGHACHARHNTEDVVVHGIDTNLGRRRAGNSAGREDELEDSVVNAREVARPAGLVLLGPEREGIHVDSSVRGTGVVLEGLDNIEVGSLTLGEAVLAVKLELRRDDGVLSPAVHREGSLGEDEGAGIGDSGLVGGGDLNRGAGLKEAGVDEGGGPLNRVIRAERLDGVGEGINGIRVVEGLGAEGLEEGLSSNEGLAVIDVGIRLNNPDKLLAGVVEVELDLVGGGSDGLVSSELELLEEILVGVLRHLPALIRVEEDVVNVEGRSNKGLLVGSRDRDGAGGGTRIADGPEALTDGAEIEVDLHLVVLEGNEGEGKSRVPAEPELERHVERGLREGLAGRANLSGAARGSAGSTDRGERGVSDVGELRGVSDHLVVSTLLLGGERKLVPDVHPVTILAIDALASNLDLNLGDEVLADVIHPAGIGGSGAGGSHLSDLGEGDLEVGAVSEISVPGNRAGDAASEVSLSGEGLLDGLHREVGVAPVGHLPESDLGRSREENVLRAVSYKLHKSSAHVVLIYHTKRKKSGKITQLIIFCLKNTCLNPYSYQ